MTQTHGNFDPFNPRWVAILAVCLVSISSLGCFDQPSKSAGSASVSVEDQSQAPETGEAQFESANATRRGASPDSYVVQAAFEPPSDSSELDATAMRLFLEDAELPGQPVSPGKPLTEEQLHKNFTLLMLAYEPDIRARDITKYLRDVLTDEQQRLAIELVLKENHKFEKLKQRRAEVLEHAYDGQDVLAQLRKIESETVYLSQHLRFEIHQKILTSAQKALRAEQRAIKDEQRALEKEAEQGKTTATFPNFP